MDYLDFELIVRTVRGRKLSVLVTEAPDGGHPSAESTFPFSTAQLEMHQLKLRNALLESAVRVRRSPDRFHQTVQTFGHALFDSLMAGEIGNSYRANWQQAADAGKGLRVRLRIEDPELASLPWEFLYDPRHAEFLCLDQRTPIVRWLGLPFRAKRFIVDAPLRILGMIAAPPGDGPMLDVDREKWRVEQAIEQLQEAGAVELVWLQGQTWIDLQQAMWTGPWHVFHFIGHGGFNPRTDEGEILLADAKGRPSSLGATMVGRLLADHAPLRLVLLNSCVGARGSDRDLFSSTAATLIQRGIPAVLAMQYPITDDAAVSFSHAFYRALVHGLPVDTAVTAARKALSIELGNTVEWGTPVFFMNVPDGRIFDIKVQQAEPQEKIQPQKQLAKPYEEARQAMADSSWDVAVERLEKVVRFDARYADAAALLNEARKQQALANLLADASEHYQAGEWDRVAGVVDRIRELDATYTDSQGFLERAQEIWRAQREQSSRVERVEEPAEQDSSPKHGMIQFPPTDERITPENVDRLRVWNLLSDSASLSSIAFAPDGQTLASASDDKTVRLWRVVDGMLLRTLEGHTGSMSSVAFAPDGQLLASASIGYSGSQYPVILWQVADGTLLRTLEGHTGSVSSVAFAPDGQLLASASYDKTVRLWRVADGTLLRTLEIQTGLATNLSSSPDVQAPASGIFGRAARIWRVADEMVKGSLKAIAESATCVAFSPDGQTVASGYRNSRVTLWRVADGTLLRTLVGHTKSVNSVAFAPDGQLLASASGGFIGDQFPVALWRVADGTLLRTLEGHTGSVSSVAFAPDGQLLASASGGLSEGQKTVALWRVADGTLLRTLEGHSGAVESIAFAPDGQLLVSAGYDKTIRLWRLTDS